MTSMADGMTASAVGEWVFDGDDGHNAGPQRAVEGDIIFEKHIGLCNYVSIVGENPKQMRVVVASDEAHSTLGNTTGERYFLADLGSIRVVRSALTTSAGVAAPAAASSSVFATAAAQARETAGTPMLRFLYNGNDETKHGLQLVFAGDVCYDDEIGKGKIVATSHLKPLAFKPDTVHP